MDYFVREAGEIFGITRNLPVNDRGPKRILEYVLYQVAEFKKLNQVIFLPNRYLYSDLLNSYFFVNWFKQFTYKGFQSTQRSQQKIR